MKYELPSFSVYLSTPEYAKGYEGINWGDDSFEMVIRCAQSQHPGGIYRDLTDEERQGLVAVDVVSPGTDYLRPEPAVPMSHKPLDEDQVRAERTELGLADP